MLICLLGNAHSTTKPVRDIFHKIFHMTTEQITNANRELRAKSPLEIVKWAITQAQGRAVVSTNYGPYEAVMLHLATQVQPDIRVLWVDHGYNRPATYRHAEQVKKLLKLNVKAFVKGSVLALTQSQ
jgi:phosphoadenosine phosphosulfate reductase